MIPVFGGEVEEGEQRFPILGQAGDRLLVLGAVFVGEHVDGGLGGRAGRCSVNLTKVCLHVDLDRAGDLVEHVGGLMNPTPLVPGAGKDLIDCLPEAERAVPHGEIRRDLEPAPLDVDEELAPALRALPHAGTRGWNPTSAFLPSGVAQMSTSMHSALSSMRACR